MATFNFLFLWLAVVFQHLISAQTYEIKTVIVNIGHSAEFSCNHSRHNLQYLRWVYKRHDRPNIEIDLYDLTSNITTDNYKASCRANEPVCRLKLLKAKEESAGVYICKTLNGDFNVINPTINLVVGGLKCQSNIGADRAMIGENDCKNVPPDILNRTCMFEYHGNLTQSPVLGWIRRYKNGHKIEESFHPGHLQGLNIFSLHDDIKITNDMNEVFFKCHARGFSQIEPCSLPTFSVLSIKSTNSKILMSENPENVNCSFISSGNVKCSCSWTLSFGMAELKINSCFLSEIYRRYPGTYVCNVICQLSAHRECHMNYVNSIVVEAKKMEILNSEYQPINPLIIVNVVLMCLVAVVLLVFVLIRLKCLQKQRNSSLESELRLMRETKQVRNQISDEQKKFQNNQQLALTGQECCLIENVKKEEKIENKTLKDLVRQWSKDEEEENEINKTTKLNNQET